MEEHKYGDLTVRVSFGKENLTDLMVEYMKGLAEMRIYSPVTYVGDRGKVLSKPADTGGLDEDL